MVAWEVKYSSNDDRGFRHRLSDLIAGGGSPGSFLVELLPLTLPSPLGKGRGSK